MKCNTFFFEVIYCFFYNVLCTWGNTLPLGIVSGFESSKIKSENLPRDMELSHKERLYLLLLEFGCGKTKGVVPRNSSL